MSRITAGCPDGTWWVGGQSEPKSKLVVVKLPWACRPSGDLAKMQFLTQEVQGGNWVPVFSKFPGFVDSKLSRTTLEY